jgi:type III pantothenate kinase
MLLADIGNSRIHIYNGKDIEHLDYESAFKKYARKKVKYISVQHRLKDKLKELKNWEDISDKIRLKGEYFSMGVDRKALCLSYDNGLFISAGSAITVDIMENGEYKGGFILLGLRAYIKAYSNISKALDIKLNRDIKDTLAKNTTDSISYGIIYSIISIIEKHSKDKKVYITGGDGEFLSKFLKGSIYNEGLIFKGIERGLKFSI